MFFSGGGGFHPGMFPPGAFPGGMPGMGGHGHGRGHHHEEEVDNTSLYALLEVAQDASSSEIKKSYMRKAMKGEYAHPDKGGNAVKFQQLQNAYEILSDADKREKYDRGGLAAAQSEGGGGGGGAEDLFSMLFGGGGGRGGGGPRGPRKGEDTKHPLRVSLEDCYKGKAVKIAITRTIVAEDASGTLMDGRTGKRYSKRNERDVLDVYLDKGARDGQRYTFEGKGDVQPGSLPGDVILVVQVTDHAMFERQGADLILKRSISLYESLCGVSFIVQHLDGRKLLIKSRPGEVIKPDALKEVADEGMPVLGHTQVKGALYIKFEVVYPESVELTESMRKVMAGILKAPPSATAAGGALSAKERESIAAEAVLEAPNLDGRRQREQLAKEMLDPDDEEGGRGGGGGVQCAQQ